MIEQDKFNNRIRVICNGPKTEKYMELIEELRSKGLIVIPIIEDPVELERMQKFKGEVGIRVDLSVKIHGHWNKWYNRFGFTEQEQAVAEWVWQNNRVAGKFTDTLRGCEGFYLPIIGKNHTLGVIGIRLTKKGELSSDELSFIESSVNQMAAALEREFHHDIRKTNK